MKSLHCINRIKRSTKTAGRTIARESIFFCALLMLPGAVFPQERGGYAGSFARFGVGARAKSLGGAYQGLHGDAYSVYYNPSNLSDIESKEFAVSVCKLSLDRELSYAGMAMKLPPAAGVGIGVIRAGVNNIDGRDLNGEHTVNYQDNQYGFLFGFGIKMNKSSSIGIGGTYYREELVSLTAVGFGFNGGAHIRLSKNIAVGAAVKDIGAHYSWNSEGLYERGSTTKDSFPAVYSAGAAYSYARIKSMLLFSFSRSIKGTVNPALGIEHYLTAAAVLRAGYTRGSLSGGGEIKFPVRGGFASLTYAAALDDIDPQLVHVFSIGLRY